MGIPGNFRKGYQRIGTSLLGVRKEPFEKRFLDLQNLLKRGLGHPFCKLKSVVWVFQTIFARVTVFVRYERIVLPAWGTQGTF